MKQANEIDYANIGFGYIQTPYNLRCTFKNGAWGPIEVHTEESVNLHMSAVVLHYGQAAFEGLKAFRGADGKVRIFRPEQNGERMQRSADYLQMAVPPMELFLDMVRRSVELNIEYVPPLESGGSLYIRPVLFGSSAQLGVNPADEYTLIVFTSPVGSYFKGGMRGIKTIIDRDHDRAAPLGTGHIKAGGNYAASLKSAMQGHHKGYDSVLYLDPAEHKFLDECGAANFFGIKDNTYCTPASHSILPSITNLSIQQLCRDLGMKVERRAIPLEELSSFTEVGACGTAAVITPIQSVLDPLSDTELHFKCIGKCSQQLYDLYRGIQLGTQEDTHGWNTVL
ncbi:MAG: branched-chain amino acid aminotransferase [Mucinivorans sp.]